MSYAELAQVLRVTPEEARRWADEAHLPKVFKAHGELVLAPLKD